MVCQACKNAKYKICRNGACLCPDKFKDNVEKTDCVPEDTLHFDGCPSTVKIGLNGQLACDCTNRTNGRFIDDPNSGNTCKLDKTICDDGGQNLCASRGASCVINPLNLDQHSCRCSPGKLFSDGNSELNANVLRNSNATCIDICRLPYMENQCAAIGATCNPIKFIQAIKGIYPLSPSSFRKILAKQYCDCAPGMFYNSKNGEIICVQEPLSWQLKLTFQWSHDLQDKLDQFMREIMINDRFSPEVNNISLPNTISFADPMGYVHALMRIREASLSEQFLTEKNGIKKYEEDIKRILLLNYTENMLYNFRLIERNSQFQTIQIVHMEKIILDRKPNYLLDLGLKLNNPAARNSFSLLRKESIADFSASIDMGARGAADDNTATISSTFLDSFGIIMESCVKYKNDSQNCIIPYTSTVMGVSNSSVPSSHNKVSNKIMC